MNFIIYTQNIIKQLKNHKNFQIIIKLVFNRKKKQSIDIKLIVEFIRFLIVNELIKVN